MKLKIAEPLVITDDSDLEYIRKTYVRETKVNFICKKCGRNYYGILRYLHKCEQKDAMPLGWLMNVR